MKIIHICKSSWPNKGGVEDHVGFVVQHQADLGHKVEIISLADMGMVNQKKPNKMLVWKWIWRNRAQFLKSDLIQVHDVMWWLLPIFLAIRHKTILTFHGWEGRFPIPIKYKLIRWLQAQMAVKTVHIGGWIQKFYWDKPDLVLYGGVEAKIKKSAAKKVLKKPVKTSVKPLQITFLGRLEAENDIQEYLILLDELRARGKAFEIAWVGDGGYRQKCQKYGRVTGMITDVDKYLENSQVVFASSYLSILKAQAAGKLVVGIAKGQLKQAYLNTFPGKKLMIIANGGDNAVEQLVKFLKQSKNLPRLQAQLNKYIQKFSWQNIAGQYLLLAKQLQ